MNAQSVQKYFRQIGRLVCRLKLPMKTYLQARSLLLIRKTVTAKKKENVERSYTNAVNATDNKNLEELGMSGVRMFQKSRCRKTFLEMKASQYKKIQRQPERWRTAYQWLCKQKRENGL